MSEKSIMDLSVEEVEMRMLERAMVKMLNTDGDLPARTISRYQELSHRVIKGNQMSFPVQDPKTIREHIEQTERFIKYNKDKRKEKRESKPKTGGR